jgi:DNA anti-recombination protein RmuC
LRVDQTPESRADGTPVSAFNIHAKAKRVRRSDMIAWIPVEDYQRLTEAQERADVEGVENAGKQLETRVKACARTISEKYLNPPKTTDFGILFLPIEGLFAEVIRRTGLIETIQRESRVIIAGPTTLWSILNSLQMGFRTLAIRRGFLQDEQYLRTFPRVCS